MVLAAVGELVEDGAQPAFALGGVDACNGPSEEASVDGALEIAAKHGCHPLRGVATYEDLYKLTYVRGPSGIIVMLAEALTKD